MFEQHYGDWWDPYSNQPYKLTPSDKPRYGVGNLVEYAKIFTTTVALAPALGFRFAILRPKPSSKPAKEFVGLSVSPDPQYNSAIVDMVEELGVQELLLRVPSWDINNLETQVEFAEQFSGKNILINVLQNRESVLDQSKWRTSIETIFEAFSPLASVFQIGNAINRTKWGCAHSGEYLQLMNIAQDVSVAYPDVKLLGSSVIDFEPLVTLRTLINFHRYQLHACAAQLYVNRRGSVYSKQYGYFNLERKLRLIYAMVSLANRSEDKLWITETNWPLLNTKPYTPNSGHPRSTVDEQTQAEYLKQYYLTAYQTGWVEKVYWWQLINPGYGLVDHRNGNLREHPSYYALKELLSGSLNRGC